MRFDPMAPPIVAEFVDEDVEQHYPSYAEEVAYEGERLDWVDRMEGRGHWLPVELEMAA